MHRFQSRGQLLLDDLRSLRARMAQESARLGHRVAESDVWKDKYDRLSAESKILTDSRTTTDLVGTTLSRIVQNTKQFESESMRLETAIVNLRATLKANADSASAKAESDRRHYEAEASTLRAEIDTCKATLASQKESLSQLESRVAMLVEERDLAMKALDLAEAKVRQGNQERSKILAQHAVESETQRHSRLKVRDLENRVVHLQRKLVKAETFRL
ncbi:MAG: uncharacterized protein KVP18_002420 [Porospora cf. gigantea A]|uniref:uncharacterized protein n=1 Tax=Porospora cf. gigantea A TaxID=2853593 RepID=UPI00355AA1F1|nr:MAG: hypothetical protein KVP18_002420 [Porospora cf. gigantea A]